MLWLQENLPSLLTGLTLLAVVAVIVWRMAQNHKAGKSGCGCGCKGCANSPFCHPPKGS